MPITHAYESSMNPLHQWILVTHKTMTKKSHDVKGRKPVRLVTEVHAREHLQDLMALYSFSISN